MNDVPQTRMPRWAKLLLVVSLALNLAIAGLVAGIALRGGPYRDSAIAGSPLVDGFRRMHRAMPEADQAALHMDLKGRGDALRTHRRQLRETRAAFLEALTAEPFSEDDLRATLERQSTQWEDLGAETREILITRINAMTPEARSAFAANLKKAMRRGSREAHKN
ncbi:MAG: periplasmic heavy metal sensor [Pseudomonadota bacterium]